MTVQEQLGLADQIAQAIPDASELHRRITAQPGGRFVSAQIRGSEHPTWDIALQLVQLEAAGGCEAGFCRALLVAEGPREER